MSGVPLETCWAFNKLWNNKFCYKLHLVGISTESYNDARIHEYQINADSEIRTKHVNEICGHTVELFNVKFSDKCSNHLAIQG